MKTILLVTALSLVSLTAQADIFQDSQNMVRQSQSYNYQPVQPIYNPAADYSNRYQEQQNSYGNTANNQQMIQQSRDAYIKSQETLDRYNGGTQ